MQGSFAVEALGSVGASLGLNVQVNYNRTSSTSRTISWNFRVSAPSAASGDWCPR
ncbi:hypothetical protein ACFPC0_19585 [Streptomyces andamanensis]|uniref:Uncharacterized protein n=1 Tax=Streptomyces andamanensis TaxID=1565035 RepID=A0ABV8TGZ2_9ACTN